VTDNFHSKLGLPEHIANRLNDVQVFPLPELHASDIRGLPTYDEGRHVSFTGRTLEELAAEDRKGES
jgi:hypothetical protein